MRRCPITYEQIAEDERYSSAGLKQLSRTLTDIAPLPFTEAEQIHEAMARADKMSIQGVQPKLSAVLRVKEGRFDIVDRGGTYILKPQIRYPEVPENEAITMTLAASLGIDVPVHGLVEGRDKHWTYFIKRFDRLGKGRKLPVEDFAQLAGATRETKYRSSMEQVARIVETHCTFPMIELRKLFVRTLFNFLTGNEDMHLKNFSLITRDGKVELTPAYDFLNSTIALPNPMEELALPLKGKKARLTRKYLIAYYGEERLELNKKVIGDVLGNIQRVIPFWRELIDRSFLSAKMKERYTMVLDRRLKTLGL